MIGAHGHPIIGYNYSDPHPPQGYADQNCYSRRSAAALPTGYVAPGSASKNNPKRKLAWLLLEHHKFPGACHLLTHSLSAAPFYSP